VREFLKRFLRAGLFLPILALSIMGLPIMVGGAAAQTAEQWNQVIAAAKREGKLVVFSAYVGAPTNKAIAQAFEKKYGIQVDTLDFRGIESRERIRVEQAAGRHSVDVIHNAWAQETAMRDVDHTLAPHGGVPNAARIKAPFKATDHFLPIFTINYAILVNSTMVKPADEPKSWRDLTDPKWKGKILMDDPRPPGGGYVWFFATHDKLGRAYQEKMTEQSLSLTRDFRESARRVARGEFPVYLPYILSDYLNLKGLPVRYVIPEEGVTYATYAAAILNGAPHPNAARLLLDFYLSDEGQSIYLKEAHGAVVDGVKVDLAPDVAALANVKLFGTNDPARADEMYGLAKEIYKKY
jgi:iron(III) transport system substrate-binding protein